MNVDTNGLEQKLMVKLSVNQVMELYMVHPEFGVIGSLCCFAFVTRRIEYKHL